MKPAAVRTPIQTSRAGGYARHRFALGGLALALAAGLGTPALARTIAHSGTMPIEVAIIAVGFAVAAAFLVAGWVLGRKVDRLAEEARRDPVTKVGNRRHWEECLLHEVDAAARAKMPLSLIMVDVDNLKTLNDVGGHVAGDLALKLVGQVLNDTCRSRDVAARFGGDEFAILLPRTRATEARVVAERIRSALFELRAGQGAPVESLLTVSVGIADLDLIDETDPHVLLEAADRALYVAKQAGRNRVEMYERPMNSSVIVLADVRNRKRRRTTRSG